MVENYTFPIKTRAKELYFSYKKQELKTTLF